MSYSGSDLCERGARAVGSLLAAATLGGCAGTPNPELERRHAEYGPYCERLGILSGTMGFGECVMWQEMVDIEQKKARAQR